MLRNEETIRTELLKLSVENLEDLSVFSKSKTKRVLANRLLKLHYKEEKVYTIMHSKAEVCSFPETEEFGKVKAFSERLALLIFKRDNIFPAYKRLFQLNEYMEGISLEYYKAVGEFESESESYFIEYPD